MEEVKPWPHRYLVQRMEALHSTILAVTVALEACGGPYEPEEFVPCLKKLGDDSYEILEHLGIGSNE